MALAASAAELQETATLQSEHADAMVRAKPAHYGT
jgi:hypothetical protein